MKEKEVSIPLVEEEEAEVIIKKETKQAQKNTGGKPQGKKKGKEEADTVDIFNTETDQ